MFSTRLPVAGRSRDERPTSDCPHYSTLFCTNFPDGSPVSSSFLPTKPPLKLTAPHTHCVLNSKVVFFPRVLFSRLLPLGSIFYSTPFSSLCYAALCNSAGLAHMTFSAFAVEINSAYGSASLSALRFTKPIHDLSVLGTPRSENKTVRLQKRSLKLKRAEKCDNSVDRSATLRAFSKYILLLVVFPPPPVHFSFVVCRVAFIILCGLHKHAWHPESFPTIIPPHAPSSRQSSSTTLSFIFLDHILKFMLEFMRFSLYIVRSLFSWSFFLEKLPGECAMAMLSSSSLLYNGQVFEIYD